MIEHWDGVKNGGRGEPGKVAAQLYTRKSSGRYDLKIFHKKIWKWNEEKIYSIFRLGDGLGRQVVAPRARSHPGDAVSLSAD